jgi:hypothetical protein
VYHRWVFNFYFSYDANESQMIMSQNFLKRNHE